MNTYTPIGASQPIQLDENNNFIDPVTGELMHQLTVEEMPSHTFGAELYATDAVRPTAHWISDSCGSTNVVCSACNAISFAAYNFCPHCGKRMVNADESL